MIRPLPLLLLALAACAPALRAGELPSRDPRVVLPLLRHTDECANLRSIERILGRPDAAFVSGLTVYAFRLQDSTSVYVSTRDQRRIFGIRRSAPGEVATTIYEYLHDDLLTPVPTSAPF